MILGLACVTCASGGTILLTATAEGWVTATANNGSYAANDYVTGNCGAGDCYTGEFRNFFEFGIPALNGPVLSATLLLDTGYPVLQQSGSIVYQVTSVAPAFGFDDLGAGTVYGSRTYTAANRNQVDGIVLDTAALADIQQAAGGTFTLGGRVTSSAAFGAAQPDQLIFGRTDSPQQLEIVVGSSRMLLDSAQTIPEPGPAALLGAGLLLVVVRRLRR
jgi:hypothetical protein